MKQKQNKVWIVSFVLIGILSLLYFQIDVPLSVAYDYQCSLPQCPSGYTLHDKYCEDKTCYGVCEKPVPAYCDSYGSWRMKEVTENWDGSTDRGDYYESPKLYMSSDKCYTAKAEARFIPNDMGTADSFKLYVAGAWQTGSQCSNGYTTTLSLPEKDYGHSSTTSTWTSAQVIDYGDTFCSGGDPWTNMKGLITMTIKYREADWIDDEVITDKVSCSFECSRDSDCGDDGYTGSKFCSGGDVVQNYKTYDCSNYECSSSQEEQIVTFCDYGCENSQCIQKDLVNYYRLQNNVCDSIQIYEEDKTYNDYLTLSECQSHILEDSVTVYRLEDNCNSIYIKVSQRTNNDYDTRALCMEHMNQKVEYYRLTDNQCDTIMIYPNEKMSYDYLTLQECNDAKNGDDPDPVDPENYWVELILGGITLLLLIVLVVVMLVRKKPRGRYNSRGYR